MHVIQSFQPHKIFMRVTCASVENTEYLLTPLLPQLHACLLSVSYFHFWKMLHYHRHRHCSHHEPSPVKTTKYIEVVTFEKMKMSGDPSLVPRGLRTRLTKPIG